MLRHLVLEDAIALYTLSKEEANRTWLPSQVYRDHAHARSVLESLIAHYSTPGNPREGPYVLAIEFRTDGTLIGHVGFSPLDDKVKAASPTTVPLDQLHTSSSFEELRVNVPTGAAGS